MDIKTSTDGNNSYVSPRSVLSYLWQSHQGNAYSRHVNHSVSPNTIEIVVKLFISIIIIDSPFKIAQEFLLSYCQGMLTFLWWFLWNHFSAAFSLCFTTSLLYKDLKWSCRIGKFILVHALTSHTTCVSLSWYQAHDHQQQDGHLEIV